MSAHCHFTGLLRGMSFPIAKWRQHGLEVCAGIEVIAGVQDM